MAPNEIDPVNEKAEASRARYLARSSKSFCETAIHLMLTCMSVGEVIRFLEGQAGILKEYE